MGVPRAPEIMTQYHRSAGFKVNSEPIIIDAILSPKIDGSLMCVTVYPRDWFLTKTILEQINNIYDNPDYDFVAGISTQNTIVITDAVTESYVSKAIGDKDIFFSKINDFVALVLRSNTPVTICFEVVCENRVGADGIEHAEYAIRYSSNFHTFIAYIELESQDVFYHYKIKQSIFTEPEVVYVKDNNELCRAMENLSSSLRTAKNDILHPEGYVIYSGNNVYKIKTIEYYWSHTERADSKSAERMYMLGKELGSMFLNSLIFSESFDKLRSLLDSMKNYVASLLSNPIILDKLPAGLRSKMETISDKRKVAVICNTIKDIEFEIISKYFNFKFHNSAKWYREFISNAQDGLTFDQEYEFYLLYKKNQRLSTPPRIYGAYIFGCRHSTDTDIAIVLDPIDIDKYTEERVTEDMIREMMFSYIDPIKPLICVLSR